MLEYNVGRNKQPNTENPYEIEKINDLMDTVGRLNLYGHLHRMHYKAF